MVSPKHSKSCFKKPIFVCSIRLSLNCSSVDDPILPDFVLFLLLVSIFAAIAGYIFYTVVEEDADFIVLPGFPEHISGKKFLEIVEFGYSKVAVVEDGCILTSCTPIVHLFLARHDDLGLECMHVAIVEEEAQHYVLREVAAIPEVDSDSISSGSDLSVMDSDTTNPEFPPDIMDASDSEEDPSYSSEEGGDDDEEEEDVVPAPLLTLIHLFQLLLLPLVHSFHGLG